MSNLATSVSDLKSQILLSSDEEIDSDLASLGGDSEARSVLSDERHPNPSSQAVSNTTLALTAGLSSFRPSSPKSSLSSPKNDVAFHEVHEDTESGAHIGSDSNSEEETDPAILENITAAATSRNLSNAAARRVDTDEGTGISEGMPSHPEMLGRILDTLRPTSMKSTPVVPSLPSLEQKVAQLHSKKKRLSVPLPAPESARIERSVAYRQSMEEMTEKWQETVSHNRRADHLSFPLVNTHFMTSTNDLSSRPPSQRHGASKHELEIEDILTKAGVESNRNVEQNEDAIIGGALTSGKVSMDELLRRRRELAHIRSLAFHYDQKMKRIKKIKSKKYRRIMKKERGRIADADVGTDINSESQEALESERRRIEERVTLRHKNTSKWIRRQLQRGEGKSDVNTRAAIEDQLRMHEELKRRQMGEAGSSDGEDGSDSDGEHEATDDEKLRRLKIELQNEGPEHKEADKKGVMSLRFMQAAMERKRQEALRLFDDEDGNDIDDFDKARFIDDHNSRQEDKLEDPRQISDDVLEVNGIEDGTKEGENDDLERRAREAYDDAAAIGGIGDKTGEGLGTDSTAAVIKSIDKSKSTFATRLGGRLTADDNPWLNGFVYGNDSEHAKADDKPSTGVAQMKSKQRKKLDLSQRVTPTVKTGKDSLLNNTGNNNYTKAFPVVGNIEEGKDSTPSLSEIKKRRRKNASLKDGNLNSSKQTVEPKDSECKQSTKSKKTFGKLQVRNIAGPSGVIEAPSDVNARERMENIALAFAGAGGADLAEFEEAKQIDIQESLPTAKSLNAEILPGWGQWHGAGMAPETKQKASETPFARAARERLAAAQETAVRSRSDRHMRNVILEQKRYDTASKLTVGFVPFPFQSREQWENELSRPLSRELMGNKAFRMSIDRRINTRIGKVVDPISKPLPKQKEDPSNSTLVRRGVSKGKKGVIDLRKRKSMQRNEARRGLLS